MCLCVKEKNGKGDEFHTLIDMDWIEAANADITLERRGHFEVRSL